MSLRYRGILWAFHFSNYVRIMLFWFILPSKYVLNRTKYNLFQTEKSRRDTNLSYIQIKRLRLMIVEAHIKKLCSKISSNLTNRLKYWIEYNDNNVLWVSIPVSFMWIYCIGTWYWKVYKWVFILQKRRIYSIFKSDPFRDTLETPTSLEGNWKEHLIKGCYSSLEG